jgi:hypothetical protein
MPNGTWVTIYCDSVMSSDGTTSGSGGYPVDSEGASDSGGADAALDGVYDETTILDGAEASSGSDATDAILDGIADVTGGP